MTVWNCVFTCHYSIFDYNSESWARGTRGPGGILALLNFFLFATTQCFNSDFDDYIHFVWFANSFICSIICLSDFVKAYERCLTNGQHKISAGRSKKRQLPPKHNVFNQANKKNNTIHKVLTEETKEKVKTNYFQSSYEKTKTGDIVFDQANKTPRKIHGRQEKTM